MKKKKALNGYAGIGGNRRLWKNVEVTAIENVQAIANVYQAKFPNDKVIVADAHKYLLEHYQEFDFIGIELNEEYVEIANKRLKQENLNK